MRSTGIGTILRIRQRRLARKFGLCGRGWVPLVLLPMIGGAAMLVGIGMSRRHPVVLPLQAGKLQVTVLDVGQGEASFVRTPEGQFIVIGTGPPELGARVAAALREAGAQKIDLLCLPYPYADAIGGTSALMSAFPVVKVVESVGTNRSYRWLEQARALCEQRNIPVFDVHTGDTILIGKQVKIDVEAPAIERLKVSPEGANNSLALRLRYGTTAFLWTGGLDRAGEDALLGRTTDLAANWLRVAHFGSANATSPELLQVVAPDIAVISVGLTPGFPAQDTLTRLQASGAAIYRTDAASQPLRFYSDGAQISSPPPQ